MFCFFVCLFVFFLSGVFFGKGGVADLFTKQLCFIGSHKVVQYLVNCFSDNQAIPAFCEQMGDSFSWITLLLKLAQSLEYEFLQPARSPCFTLMLSHKTN